MPLKPDKQQTEAWLQRRHQLMDRLEQRFRELDEGLREVELRMQHSVAQPESVPGAFSALELPPLTSGQPDEAAPVRKSTAQRAGRRPKPR